MSEPEPRMQRSQFLERLLAAFAFGVALIAGAHGYYFAAVRGPLVRAMLQDFGSPPSDLGHLSLSWPWLPGVVALCGCAAAGLVWRSPRRWSLVCVCVLAFGGLALTIAAELAACWPADHLLRSISG